MGHEYRAWCWARRDTRGERGYDGSMFVRGCDGALSVGGTEECKVAGLICVGVAELVLCGGDGGIVRGLGGRLDGGGSRGRVGGERDC